MAAEMLLSRRVYSLVFCANSRAFGECSWFNAKKMKILTAPFVC